MKKLLSLMLVMLLAVTMFAACGTTEKTSEDVNTNTETEATGESASDSAEKETLTMATNATFPPYEYYEGESIVGIDAEIAAAIAEKLGMELEIADTEFGSIIAGVQTGKFDMGMAGMTVTDERKQSVNFTDSYATGVQSIIVPEGSDIKTPEDLKDKKIGVQQDTTGHIYAEEEFGTDFVTPFNKGTDAVAALTSGKVDCVIIDNEPAKSYVAANTGLVILDTEYAVEEYAICIAKENTELLDKVNGALNELIADGTVAQIIAKYISAE